MKAPRWISFCILFAASSAVFASNADGITISHYEPLERISFVQNGTAVLQKPNSMLPVTMSFDALGRTFDLELEPNTALLNGTSQFTLGSDVSVYRGTIAGEPASWTRIVVANGMPRGLIFDGREMYAIEAPDDGLLATGAPVIYRLADLYIEPGTLSCAAGEFAANGAAMYQAVVTEMKTAMAQGPGATHEMDIGVVGDFEFTNDQGANADTALVTRINNVDGIFSAEVQVQLTIQTVETFTDPADPFSDATDVNTLINEVGLYRQGNPAQSQQGLTHLYTTRDLDGSTVGVAYTGALCSTRFGAGLSEANRGANFDSLIAAHEIGHNFGAPHDGEVGSVCETEAQTFLMAPSVNGSNEFSPCSKVEMADDIANATGVCINPLPSVDMTVGPTGQPPTVLLGNAANVTFDIVNNGTLQATNVMADVALPGNVTLIAASASQGTCTNGAATVSCSLGNVAGSSGGTLTVTASTDAVGPAVFDVTVSSDVDDNLANNQRSLQVTIDPAVNLTVSLPSNPRITVNQSTNVNVALENTSILDATGVALTVTFDAGLQADNLSWSIGSCTVSGQQVDCTANTFASQSASSLSFRVTGTSEGTLGYTVNMASNEADSDPSNNNVSGSVTVRAENDDDEGSGSFGVLFLCLLGGALLRRRLGIAGSR